MKAFWKKLKRFLFLKDEDIGPGLRKKLIVLNLVLTALILLMMWAGMEYPLPTAELEFRRLERTHLLPRSEIVFVADEKSRDGMAVSSMDQSAFSLDGIEFHLRRGPWIAGVGEEYAVLACASHESWRQDLIAVPLEQEGASLLAFPAGYGYWVEADHSQGATYTYHNFFSLLAVDVPEETARAEITVVRNGVSVTGPGWNMGNQVWLLAPDNHVLPSQNTSEETYTLRLYRDDGSLLLERSGTL